jgi:hypothetical protein
MQNSGCHGNQKKKLGVKIILVNGEFLYTGERFQGHHGPLV